MIGLIRRIWRYWNVHRWDATSSSYTLADPRDPLEDWLADGDPLTNAPDIELGVWLTPEQSDDLVLLAVELWPRNEYFAIVTEYERETS